MLTNKGEISATGFPVEGLVIFKDLSSPGVCVKLTEDFAFITVADLSLSGKRSLKLENGADAFFISVDPQYGVSVIVADRDKSQMNKAVQFATEPLRIGATLNMVVQGGNLSAQVLESDFYLEDRIIDTEADKPYLLAPDTRPDYPYVAVRGVAMAPIAILDTVFSQASHGGVPLFDTITGKFSGFAVGKDTITGGTVVADQYYLSKGLLEATDGFMKAYNTLFFGHPLEMVLSISKVYDAIRSKLPFVRKHLGINTVYVPEDDALLIAQIPTVVDRDGMLVEAFLKQNEIQVVTPANRCEQLMRDHHNRKHNHMASITGVDYTDWQTGKKKRIGSGRGGNGGNGSTAGDIATFDGINPTGAIMKTALDTAVLRYTPGTPFTLQVEWTSIDGQKIQQSYEIYPDERTTDIFDGKPVQRRAIELPPLFKNTEQAYLRVPPGARYTCIDAIQAAVMRSRGVEYIEPEFQGR